jgi:hypothetical protein
MCVPKFEPSDLTPVDKIPKCRTLNATLSKLCPECVSNGNISDDVANQLSDYFSTLQTPK